MNIYFLFFRFLLFSLLFSSISRCAVDEKKDKKRLDFSFLNKTIFSVTGLFGIGFLTILYILKKSKKNNSNNTAQLLQNININNNVKNNFVDDDMKIPYEALKKKKNTTEPEKLPYDDLLAKTVLSNVSNNILPRPEINLPIVRYFDLHTHVYQQYKNRKKLYKKYRVLNKDTINNHKKPHIVCDQEATKAKKIEQKSKKLGTDVLPEPPVITYTVKKSFESASVNKLPQSDVENKHERNIQDSDTPKTLLSNVDNNILPRPEINLPIVRYFDLHTPIYQQYKNRKKLYKKYRVLNKDTINNHKKPHIVCDQETTKAKKIEQKSKKLGTDVLPEPPVITYTVKKSFESASVNKLPQSNVENKHERNIQDSDTPKTLLSNVDNNILPQQIQAQISLDDDENVEEERNATDITPKLRHKMKIDVLSAQEAKKAVINRVKRDFFEFLTNKKSLLAEEELKTKLTKYNMIPKYIYEGVWKNDRIIWCDYSDSILYYILKNNLTSFIDILLQAKNIYEIISLYDDQIYNFYNAIKDIRILFLLYHKRNFDEFRENKSPIEEKIIAGGTMLVHYPRVTYFNDYLRDFIVSISPQNLEKTFTKENNIFQILKNCISGKTKKLWITRDCLWRQLYFANEKRIEKNKSVQENPLTAYCVHYILYIYNTSIHALVQQKTPLASYLLKEIGKTKRLPCVNKENVMYSYTLKARMERFPTSTFIFKENEQPKRIGDLNYLLANTGWSNTERLSNDNNYE